MCFFLKRLGLLRLFLHKQENLHLDSPTSMQRVKCGAGRRGRERKREKKEEGNRERTPTIIPKVKTGL